MTRPSVVLVALLAHAAVTMGGDASATTRLAIKGMTCGGCVAAVKLQLRRTEGVRTYDVSYEKAEAHVTYDPAKTTPEKIAESVSKTGFQASVKDSPAKEPSDTPRREGGPGGARAVHRAVR